MKLKEKSPWTLGDVIDEPKFKCYNLRDRLNRVGIDQISILCAGIVLLGAEYGVLTKAADFLGGSIQQLYTIPIKARELFYRHLYWHP